MHFLLMLLLVDPACLADSNKRDKLSNFSAYNARFRMPSLESSGTLNMHFSFNFGPVHFISIDTETGYPGAAEEVLRIHFRNQNFLFLCLLDSYFFHSPLSLSTFPFVCDRLATYFPVGDLRINWDGSKQTSRQPMRIVKHAPGFLYKVILLLFLSPAAIGSSPLTNATLYQAIIPCIRGKVSILNSRLPWKICSTSMV
jgi:hypothetical protein